MNTTQVIINDYERDRRTTILLEIADFDVIDGVWEEEDRLLVELQEQPAFAGRRRWCDLDPTHFRVLLCHHLTKVAEMDDVDKSDAGNPMGRSLCRLLAAFVFCLQRRSESHIELMHVNRISETEVAYDFWACLNMALDMPRRRAGFRVIVDNT